tara:strand:- start:31 stop:702 length:672 start_codon:yes stop_codon:yes gene_type:complete
MKHILLIVTIIISMLKSEAPSSMKHWESILQTPEILSYFDDVFESLGISVEETGETFTIHHKGDRFVFEEGIIYEEVDFVVPLRLENITNMISHSKDGNIDSTESWRILDVLFTPLTKVTLEAPVLAVNWRRKLAGVEDLTHVYLLNPNGGEASKHTLIYVKGQWLVLKGIHGEPRRTYRMTPSESIEYQRKVFKALKKDNLWGWMKFASWYKKWRKKNSTTH